MIRNTILLLTISVMMLSCGNAEAENSVSKDGAKKNDAATNMSNVSKDAQDVKDVNAGDGTVTISGEMKNANNRMVYFSKYTLNTATDSALTDAQGHFKFEVSIGLNDYYKLYYDNMNMIVLILNPSTDHVSIKGDATNFPNDFTVSGSKDSELMQLYFATNRDYIARKDEAVAKIKSTKDPVEKQKFQEQLRQATGDFNEAMKSLALSNPSSPAALSMIYNLNPRDYMYVYDKVVPALEKVIPHSELFIGLKKELNTYKAKNQQKEAQKSMQNQLAPEIALNDPNGNLFKLSSLKGKYVLVDFWASWCGPCRKENPNVVRMYNTYKDKGFEILGVSLDKDKQRWVNAIAKDGLTWPQVSDLGGWNSSVVPKYGISSIPHTVLLDKEGKIIAVGLRGPSLEKKLLELMGS